MDIYPFHHKAYTGFRINAFRINEASLYEEYFSCFRNLSETCKVDLLNGSTIFIAPNLGTIISE